MSDHEEEIELITHDGADPVKKTLPRGRIFMLSTVLFFVGYGYAVNEGFGVPLLLEAGLEERYASFALGISSIINVILGGYLGSSSDRCTSPLGRRRPYIIGLTTVLLIASVLYPHGNVLSDAFQLQHDSHIIYLIFHTAICVIIFDVCLDMTNTLDRSYLFDSISAQQSSHGNAVFSFMTSAGSLFGALLSAPNWVTILHLSNGSQTKVVFATVTVVLLICVIITINSVKEAKIGKDGKLDITYSSTWTRCFICCNYFAFDPYPTGQSDIYDTEEITSMTVDENHESEPIPDESSPQQKKSCHLIMKAFYMRVYNVYWFIKSLSSSTLWLWLTQVLEWMTMLSLLFFITNFVGSIVYDGSPDAEPNSKERRAYDKGVRMGLACQGIGFGSSLFFSLFLLSKHSHKFQTRAVYVSIHVLTFMATGILIFSKSIYIVASLHVIFGCFYSWIQIIPFTLLQKYKVSFV